MTNMVCILISINRKELYMLIKHFLILLLTLLYLSCSDDPTSSEEIETGTVTDIDGNVYQAIRIGNQWWMAENLKVVHYLSGEAIVNVTEDTIWNNLTTSAYCNYNNSIDTAAIYGRLYNWYAVVDSRRIAPSGWHVATDEEWQTLVDYLGGENVAGGKLKTTGTVEEGSGLWHNPDFEHPEATNESGFSALPSGIRGYTGSTFTFLGYSALFWSSTEYGSDLAWLRALNYGHSKVYRHSYSKQQGYSVRCVKD